MKDLALTLEKILYICRFASEYTTSNFSSRYGIRDGNQYKSLSSKGFIPFADCGEFVLCVKSNKSYANSMCVVDWSGNFLINFRIPPMTNLLLTDPKSRFEYFSKLDGSAPSIFVSETFINSRLYSPTKMLEFNLGEWTEPEVDYRLIAEDEYFMHSLIKSIPPFVEFKYIIDCIERIPKFKDENLNKNIEIAVNAKSGVSEGLYNLNFNTSSIIRLCDMMHESFDYFNKDFIISE